MSLSASTYFSNSVIGKPYVGDGIDIYKVDLIPRYAVGFGFERADGSKFRYGHFSASNTNAGIVVGPEDVGATQVDKDGVVWTPSTATPPSGQQIQPGDIGSFYVQMTLGSIEADQFAGAYLVITDDTGEGYTYRVRGNTGTGDPVTGTILVELYEPLIVALGTNTDIAMSCSRHVNLVAVGDFGATGSNNAVGVTCAGTSATNYAWIQTKGIANVLTGDVVPVQGQAVQVASDVAGAIVGYTSVSSTAVTMNSYTNLVGYCVDPGDDTEQTTIMLNLE